MAEIARDEQARWHEHLLANPMPSALPGTCGFGWDPNDPELAPLVYLCGLKKDHSNQEVHKALGSSGQVIATIDLTLRTEKPNHEGDSSMSDPDGRGTSRPGPQGQADRPR